MGIPRNSLKQEIFQRSSMSSLSPHSQTAAQVMSMLGRPRTPPVRPSSIEPAPKRARVTQYETVQDTYRRVIAQLGGGSMQAMQYVGWPTVNMYHHPQYTLEGFSPNMGSSQLPTESVPDRVKSMLQGALPDRGDDGTTGGPWGFPQVQVPTSIVKNEELRVTTGTVEIDDSIEQIEAEDTPTPRELGGFSETLQGPRLGGTPRDSLEPLTDSPKCSVASGASLST